jgi:multidrug efflux pump subunit AcrB
MKNISAWAIRHPISPIVLFVVLLFMGLVEFIRMPITLNPDVAYPMVSVHVLQPGAAPTEVETQIIQKVEGSVAGIGNVHNITSLAIEGQARIFLEFNIGTPIDRAVADVRDAVAKIRVQLPQGIQEPIVSREDVDGGAIVYYAVSTTTLSEQELSWFVDNTITKRMLGVPGVAQVSRGGGVNREIRVELDPARMQALGITAVQVNEQIRQLNLNSPGGRAYVGGGEQSIRVMGGAHTALQLANTQIMLPGGRFARLSDIDRPRQCRGDPFHFPAQRPAGHHLWRLQGEGLLRRHGVEQGGGGARQDLHGKSAGEADPGLHHGRLHQEDLPLGHERLCRRLAAGGIGCLALPA